MALVEVATRFRIYTTSGRPVVKEPPTAPRFWLPCFCLHGFVLLFWLVVFQGYKSDPEVFLTVEETANSSTVIPPGTPTLFPSDISLCQTSKCICFNLWMAFRWVLWILSIEVAFFEGWKACHVFQNLRQAVYWGPSLGLYSLYYSKLAVALISLMWVPNCCFGVVFFWSRGFRGRRIGLEAGFFATYLCLVAVVLGVSTKRKYVKLLAAAIELLALKHKEVSEDEALDEDEEQKSGEVLQGPPVGRANYLRVERGARKLRLASVV